MQCVNITDWVVDRHPKNIGSKEVLGYDGVKVLDLIIQLSELLQSVVVSEYLADWKIKTVSVAIAQISADLKFNLRPKDLFRIWAFISTILSKIEKEAIEVECYEGLVNLQKLKDLI